MEQQQVSNSDIMTATIIRERSPATPPAPPTLTAIATQNENALYATSTQTSGILDLQQQQTVVNNSLNNDNNNNNTNASHGELMMCGKNALLPLVVIANQQQQQLDLIERPPPPEYPRSSSKHFIGCENLDTLTAAAAAAEAATVTTSPGPSDATRLSAYEQFLKLSTHTAEEAAAALNLSSLSGGGSKAISVIASVANSITPSAGRETD